MFGTVTLPDLSGRSGSLPSKEGLHFVWLLGASCTQLLPFRSRLWLGLDAFSQALPSLEEFTEQWGKWKKIGY